MPDRAPPPLMAEVTAGLSARWRAMFPYDAPDEGHPTHRRRAEILLGLLGRFEPGRLIDLGCGTGWFSRLAAASGWQVTAVDARRRPWPVTPGVAWRQQDARHADLSGYDLILCLGLFYHLTLGDQVALLGRCRGTPMILDTHVSADGGAGQGGYRGHFHREGPSLIASHGNPESWWPDLASLLVMLRDHGGYRVETLEPWYLPPDRTFFTCLPDLYPALFLIPHNRRFCLA